MSAVSEEAIAHKKDEKSEMLVVAPHPFFSPRGTPFSVYYRTLVLAEAGVKIDLLTYGPGQDVDIPGVRIVRIPRIRFLEPVPVGPSIKKMFLDVPLFLWTIAMMIRYRYKLVHAHEESVFWCMGLKPIFRYKMIYDMHSSLPQQLSNFGFTSSKFLIGTFRWLEDSCLRASDAVITICPDLKSYALEKGVPNDKHFLIENSIFEDVRVVGSGKVATSANQAAEEIKFGPGLPTMVYAGTFEKYQGIDRVIRAFSILGQERSDVRLLLAGGTDEQVAEMQALAETEGVGKRCVFTGRVSKTLALKFTKEADVLLSPRIDGTNTPLKIYEQLASGQPLIATNIWSHTQVLDEEVCFLVDPTPESIAEGMAKAFNDPTEAKRRAANARKLYEVDYARPIYEQKIRALLTSVGFGEQETVKA